MSVRVRERTAEEPEGSQTGRGNMTGNRVFFQNNN